VNHEKSQSEHEIQNEIKLFIESYLKGYCVRLNSGGIVRGRIKLAPPGTPDLMASVDGKFVAIEVKRSEAEVNGWKKKENLFIKTSHLSIFATREIAQIKTKNKIQASKGIYILTYSLENFVKQIESLLSKPKSE